MNTRFFITATGTDIGKTFLTAALVRQARALGRSIAAYKPVISGIDPARLAESDTGILLGALDLPLTPENIDQISPWRYAAPLAPSMAAQLEGRKLDFDALVQWSRKALGGDSDIVIIEGVAGIMAPIDHQHTVLDWIEAAQTPTLLIAGSYLGTISHTLTALLALEQRKIPLHALIINESENSSVTLDATTEELRRWTKAPLLKIRRQRADELQENIDELRKLF